MGTGGTAQICARISDQAGLPNATLFFRYGNQSDIDSLSMTQAEDSYFNTYVPLDTSLSLKIRIIAVNAASKCLSSTFPDDSGEFFDTKLLAPEPPPPCPTCPTCPKVEKSILTWLRWGVVILNTASLAYAVFKEMSSDSHSPAQDGNLPDPPPGGDSQ